MDDLDHEGVTSVADVRVGGASVSWEQARAYAQSYLAGLGGYAYPAYDRYRLGEQTDPNRIEDADLLAPVLLNVQHLSLDAYYALQSSREAMERHLRRIPAYADLAHARPQDLQPLAALFGLLDEGIPGVRGTILAKILHRKRPAFIPLVDGRIRWCYRDSPNAPIGQSQHRTEAAFMVELATAIQRDLVEQAAVWRSVADLATDVPITHPRALDIVGWMASGRHGVSEAVDDAG